MPSHLNNEIKLWADKIYALDKCKYKKLIVWINAAQRVYSVVVLAQTLRQFYSAADHLDDNWWGYLDKILDTVEAKTNARNFEKKHEIDKAREAEYARYLFGRLGSREEKR